MRTLCATLLSGISGACTIIPVHPERSEAENSVRPERSGAKSKGALFVLATLLMIAALAGCGGGGGKTAALPTPVAIDLPQGIMLEPGAALTIPAGEKRTVHEANGMRTEFTCPADGQDCVVSLTEDGAPQSTGGTPTVATYTAIEGLPSGHTLMAGTIPAGDPSRTVHRTFDTRTVVTCPAGGEDCEVTLTEDGAESTGGAPTVTTYTTLYLPSDLLLSDPTLTGGTTIPAGEVRSIGYSRGRSHVLVCPFDGEACVVTLGEYGDFESTGGAPYVVSTITNRMVWQANNGPDGTSDGARAKGFEGQMLSSGALSNLFTADPEREGANVQSTLATEARVPTTASWASSATVPTLGLTVGVWNSLSVDEDSEVPSLGEGWNGAPLIQTESTETARAVIYSNIAKQPAGGSADAYYLTLGAWLAMPADPADSIYYAMGAFANGSSASRISRSLFNLQVNAFTFEGPATGLYTRATYSGSGGGRALRSAEVGSFTVLAKLSVDFGSTTTAIAGFSGSVTDFRENGESLGDWEVSLAETSANPTGNDQLFIGSTSGSAQGRSLTGRWGVEFYRNTSGAIADYAAGTFSASTAAANNDALRIVGAFGAEIQR